MKENNQEKIIATALKMFNSRGYRATTMDDIAASLHISKRTLYETFNNKEQLFEACLKDVQHAIGEIHHKIHVDIKEPLLTTLFIAKVNSISNLGYNRLIKDAKLYLPQMHDKYFKIHSVQLRQKVEQTMQDALQKGLLREGVEVKTAVDFMCTLVQQCCVNEIEDTENYISQTNEILFTYMRGMLNLATIQQFENLEAEYGNPLKSLQEQQTTINS
ncbi:MAG: TetR/AcrR family transcriptional regulator [Bacteroidales bacterium]|nr:TetR/AcrR family transcriptional regulator [Bacteroidales bacterium]